MNDNLGRIWAFVGGMLLMAGICIVIALWPAR
jgi:hypothetical protein